MISAKQHLVAVCLAIASITLAGCGPSCAERGGQLVYTGNALTPVGQVLVMLPRYRCELPEGV